MLNQWFIESIRYAGRRTMSNDDGKGKSRCTRIMGSKQVKRTYNGKLMQ